MVLWPLQIVAFPPIDTVGVAFTVTIAVPVAVPQLAVRVTVYVVVTLGIATGFAMVMLLNPALGDQAYVPLPLALSVVLAPVQMVALFPALTEGAPMVIDRVLVAMPQLLATVSV